MTPAGWRDADTERFAALLTDYCLRVQPGQQVLVRSTTLAAPLLRELQQAILARDAWPLLRVELPAIEEDFHALALDRHLDSYASIAEAEAAQADAFLAIQAPFNTRALADVDPERIARIARSRAPLTELRMRKRWCGTLWPTPASAQQAGMSEDAFAAFVRGALFLDRDDPAAAWRELGSFQAGLVERLSSARELRIEAEGTDLTLHVGEIGIGTNRGIDRPIGTILFDEKIGGTVHLALGRSYPETGGLNESAVHWDLICDLRNGGCLTADGEVVQEGGAFR